VSLDTREADAVFLERRTVSRKTPGDGRLEITKAAALRVERLGNAFAIDPDGTSVAGTLETFACTCRGPANPHVHYFLVAERLKGLTPGSVLDLQLDEPGKRVIVQPAAPA
jgi:hypothetical protein